MQWHTQTVHTRWFSVALSVGFVMPQRFTSAPIQHVRGDVRGDDSVEPCTVYRRIIMSATAYIWTVLNNCVCVLQSTYPVSGIRCTWRHASMCMCVGHPDLSHLKQCRVDVPSNTMRKLAQNKLHQFAFPYAIFIACLLNQPTKLSTTHLKSSLSYLTASIFFENPQFWNSFISDTQFHHPQRALNRPHLPWSNPADTISVRWFMLDWYCSVITKGPYTRCPQRITCLTYGNDTNIINKNEECEEG